MRVAERKLKELGFEITHIGRYRKDYPTSIPENERKYAALIDYDEISGKVYYKIYDNQYLTADFAYFKEDCDTQEEAKLLAEAIDEFKADMKKLREKKK